MWKGNQGPCTCYFCQEGRVHPDRPPHQKWGTRRHLQVAESLNPKDFIDTRICMVCTHEEKVE